VIYQNPSPSEINESDQCRRKKRRRSFLFSVFALILLIWPSLSTDEGFSTPIKKHSGGGKVKAVAPGPPPKQEPVSSVVPKAATPVIQRIRNLKLPVSVINERLIRDIMVGKPVELPPPDGTEAFAPEVMPAPSDDSATSSPSGLAAKQPEQTNSTLTPDSIPSSVAPSATIAPAAIPEAAPAPITNQEIAAPVRSDEAGMAASAPVYEGTAPSDSSTRPPDAVPTNPVDAPDISVDEESAPENSKEEGQPDKEIAKPANKSELPDAAPRSGVDSNSTVISSIGTTGDSDEAPVLTGGEAFGSTETASIEEQRVPLASDSVMPSPASALSILPAEPDVSQMHNGEVEKDSHQSEDANQIIDQAGDCVNTTSSVDQSKIVIESDSPGKEEVQLDSASVTGEPLVDKDERVAISMPTSGNPLQPANNEAKQDQPKDSNEFTDTLRLNLPKDSILGSVEKVPDDSANGAIVIDDDEALETKQTIQYRELPTDEGKTKVLVGAQFPVVMSSQISSKTAKQGDVIEARLKYDLQIGDRLVAKKGSVVYGHLNYSLKARSTMHSLLSFERWYRNSGCLGVAFDEIINEKGDHLPLVAAPLQQARIIKNKGDGRELGVNHAGQITGPWSQQLRYKAIRIGLNAAAAPAGVFSFGAMPVALGMIGAYNPSFAFMKPVGLNVRHRRIKGFCWGFLSGVPGSFLIEDTVIKGQEAIIKPGDEFLCEFKQEFTGEPITDASLIAGASTKVHGQVMPDKDLAKATDNASSKSGSTTTEKP
jgi:hypothetical protein